MNFLAHAWLARYGSDAFLYGNLIADGVKGGQLDGWPCEVARGIRHHRRVDAYVDHHPRIVAARSRAPDGSRRYAGIALDLVWDHFLARRLDHDDALIPRCYRLLIQQPAPDRLAAMMPVMVRQDWLRRYADWQFTCRALEGLGERLSERLDRRSNRGSTVKDPSSNQLAALIPWLTDDYRSLDNDFEAFWPELSDALGAPSPEA